MVSPTSIRKLYVDFITVHLHLSLCGSNFSKSPIARGLEPRSMKRSSSILLINNIFRTFYSYYTPINHRPIARFMEAICCRRKIVENLSENRTRKKIYEKSRIGKILKRRKLETVQGRVNAVRLGFVRSNFSLFIRRKFLFDSSLGVS